MDLIEAVQKGNAAAARRLVEQGADLNTPNYPYRHMSDALRGPDVSLEQNALMLAITSGRREIVDLLLSHGSDVNACEGSKMTPLMFAAGGGQSELVNRLMDLGAMPEMADAGGRSALDWAAYEGKMDTMQKMLDRLAARGDREYLDNALVSAVECGKIDAVDAGIPARYGASCQSVVGQWG